LFKKLGSFIQRWLIGATAAPSEPAAKKTGRPEKQSRKPESRPALPPPKPQIERPSEGARKPRHRKKNPPRQDGEIEVPNLSLREVAPPEMPGTLKDVPEVRADKVKAFSDQICAGTYSVKAEDIAQKMLDGGLPAGLR